MHPQSEDLGPVLATIERARHDFDVAVLELRVQMELASWRDIPLGMVATAGSMRPSAAHRFKNGKPPCGLIDEAPEGCPVCPLNSCAYPQAEAA